MSLDNLLRFRLSISFFVSGSFIIFGRINIRISGTIIIRIIGLKRKSVIWNEIRPEISPRGNHRRASQFTDLPLFARLEILESCQGFHSQWVWHLNNLRWLHVIQLTSAKFTLRIDFDADLIDWLSRDSNSFNFVVNKSIWSTYRLVQVVRVGNFHNITSGWHTVDGECSVVFQKTRIFPIIYRDGCVALPIKLEWSINLGRVNFSFNYESSIVTVEVVQ